LKVIRPQLDEVQKSLIAELVDTAAVRTSKTCHADVAKAVGKYVSTNAHGGGPINAATLDRAFGWRVHIVNHLGESRNRTSIPHLHQMCG
jgi:hypothetical protein